VLVFVLQHPSISIQPGQITQILPRPAARLLTGSCYVNTMSLVQLYQFPRASRSPTAHFALFGNCNTTEGCRQHNDTTGASKTSIGFVPNKVHPLLPQRSATTTHRRPFAIAWRYVVCAENGRAPHNLLYDMGVVYISMRPPT
jgi:hypothetical protein